METRRSGSSCPPPLPPLFEFDPVFLVSSVSTREDADRLASTFRRPLLLAGGEPTRGEMHDIVASVLREQNESDVVCVLCPRLVSEPAFLEAWSTGGRRVASFAPHRDRRRLTRDVVQSLLSRAAIVNQVRREDLSHLPPDARVLVVDQTTENGKESLRAWREEQKKEVLYVLLEEGTASKVVRAGRG